MACSINQRGEGGSGVRALLAWPKNVTYYFRPFSCWVFVFSDCLGHERQQRSGLATHAQGHTASQSGQPLEVLHGLQSVEGNFVDNLEKSLCFLYAYVISTVLSNDE
jgi:hypothetical protein